MEINTYGEVIPGEVYTRQGHVFFKDGKSIEPLVEVLLLKKYNVPGKDKLLTAITDAATEMLPLHTGHCPRKHPQWDGEQLKDTAITLGRNGVETAVSGLPYAMLLNISKGNDKYKELIRANFAGSVGASKCVPITYGILPEHLAKELEGAGNPELYAKVFDSPELKKLGLGRHVSYVVKLRCGRFPDRQKEEAGLRSHPMPNTTLSSVLNALDAVYKSGTLGIADYSGEAFQEIAGVTLQRVFNAIQQEKMKEAQERAAAAADISKMTFVAKESSKGLEEKLSPEKEARQKEDQSRMRQELDNDFISFESTKLLDEIKARNTSYANSLRIRFEQ
ncbi:MAG: hypothetical protein KJ955_08225 [Nanoarchaeota archaeon]|nr:hypothetical protein [Nanoarchaeota archaeon]